jgi:hypothetical protein
MGDGKQSSWRTSGDWRSDLALIVWVVVSYFIATRLVKPFDLPSFWDAVTAGLVAGLIVTVGIRLTRRLLDGKPSGPDG